MTSKKPAAPAVAAPAVHTDPAKGKRTVTVACKFPPGLRLQLCRRVDYQEQTLAGTRPAHRFDKVGPVYVVRGPSEPNGQIPKGYKRPVVEGGFALTSNIPADFWEEWLEQNKEMEIVKNGFIFAHAGRDHAEGLAQEREALRTGFEPIVPDSDPRIPKSTNPFVTDVQTSARDAA